MEKQTTVRGMTWHAVIVQRPTGARLFLSMAWESNRGFIYSSKSKTWSAHTRPFDGPILAQQEVVDRDAAVSYLRAFPRDPRQTYNETHNLSRADIIKRIKKALQERSGKTWSVTGGKGTAYGWLKISAPPARCTWGSRKIDPNGGDSPENWERYDTGAPAWGMSPDDKQELARLLGLTVGQCSGGVSIPASNGHRAEYVDRAEGRVPGVYGEQYWD